MFCCCVFKGPDKSHSSFVGFSAFKQFNQTHSAGNNIIFDGVLLNEGGYYQRIQSRFECPVNGIYFVTVTAKRQELDPLLLDVEIATNNLFRLSSTESENPEDIVNNGVLTRCFEGEEISVKGAGDGSVYGHPSEVETVFTVMFMYQY